MLQSFQNDSLQISHDSFFSKMGRNNFRTGCKFHCNFTGKKFKCLTFSCRPWLNFISLYILYISLSMLFISKWLSICLPHFSCATFHMKQSTFVAVVCCTSFFSLLSGCLIWQSEEPVTRFAHHVHDVSSQIAVREWGITNNNSGS